MIWNEKMETMSRVEIEELQSDRLRETVDTLYRSVPFYKKQFDEAGLQPDDVKGIGDLTHIPFTTKADLRDNYPFGLFAVPLNEVIRTHASSGTTGKPTVVGYTRDDLQTWAEVCARCFALSGARPGEMFQNAYGYGLFTGGLGMHYGAEYMGLTVIPAGGGNTRRQIMLLRDFGPQIMACTPSYALTLADAILEQGIDPDDLNVRVFILGAEPWTEEMREELERKLKVDAVNIYGLSEIIGPGVSTECLEMKNGAHIFEDHFLPEIIDPDGGEPLQEGEVGELVFTTLTKRALPLLRYRTGDLCHLEYEPCGCGRTHARMGRILGRVDDMLIVRGVNVFPSQVEAALMGVESPYLTPHYSIILTRSNHLDEMEIQVEITEKFFRDVGREMFLGDSKHSAEEVHELQSTVRTTMKEALGLTTKVVLLPPGEGPRSAGGKLQRVVDRRVLK